MEEIQAPKDKHHVAYFILFLQGIGALLPWNLFITADAYFKERFHGTKYQDNFLNWFSISFNLSTLITITLITTILQKHLPRIALQVLVPLFGNSMVLAISTILVKCPQLYGIPMFHVTLLSTIFASINSSMLQGGIFALTTHFPESYTQAFMAGQGAAGLFISASNFIIAWSTDPPNNGTINKVLYTPLAISRSTSATDVCAFVYFLIGTVVAVSCIFGFIVFQRLPVTKYYMLRGSSSNEYSYALLKSEAHPNDPTSTMELIVQILSRVKWYAFTVFLTFFVTLSLYPGYVASIQSVNQHSMNRLFHDLFVPFLYLLFNFGDLCGRCAAAYYNIHQRAHLALFTTLRFVFFLLFFLCNTGSKKSTFFHSDLFPFGFVLCCAFTNGYFSSLAMMHSSTCVSMDINGRQQELTGQLMFLILTFGLTCGSFFSFVVN